MVRVRSTSRLSAKGLQPIIEILRSSRTLALYDMGREPGCRELKFTAVQMMAILLYIEIKKFTLEDYENAVEGRGSQMVLRNLGMPMVRGRYVAPSTGWVSTFRNHEFPKFRAELEREFMEAVIEMTAGHRIVTIDSTPAEASRYSKWADFNAHYRIRMAKVHIIMVNGIPIFGLVTNGNDGDNPEFRKMLSRLQNARWGAGTLLLSDGAYDSAETYADVFLKTGVVMSSNSGAGSVWHEEAEWDDMVRRYNRLHRERGFVPSNKAAPEFILRFLARHGQKEVVGWFLRNLDMSRGKIIHRAHAKARHVCETVHHAMKRWVDFDVRGLHSPYVGRRLMMRLFFCSLLCVLFEPYI
jgi:hypothetical protein